VNIFLDLDGVMADLESHYLATFGHKMDEATSRNQMWRNIDGHEGFWLSIPVMKGGKEFFTWLTAQCYHTGAELAILTAAPDVAEKHFPIARHKKQWVKQHLGDILVLPAYGSERKAAFVQNPGDILIDDWGKNIKAWEEEGGVGVKHVGDDFETTKKKVTEALGFSYGGLAIAG
jgi:hypothetical protein